MTLIQTQALTGHAHYGVQALDEEQILEEVPEFQGADTVFKVQPVDMVHPGYRPYCDKAPVPVPRRCQYLPEAQSIRGAGSHSLNRFDGAQSLNTVQAIIEAQSNDEARSRIVNTAQALDEAHTLDGANAVNGVHSLHPPQVASRAQYLQGRQATQEDWVSHKIDSLFETFHEAHTNHGFQAFDEAYALQEACASDGALALKEPFNEAHDLHTCQSFQEAHMLHETTDLREAQDYFFRVVHRAQGQQQNRAIKMPHEAKIHQVLFDTQAFIGALEEQDSQSLHGAIALRESLAHKEVSNLHEAQTVYDTQAFNGPLEENDVQSLHGPLVLREPQTRNKAHVHHETSNLDEAQAIFDALALNGTQVFRKPQVLNSHNGASDHLEAQAVHNAHALNRALELYNAQSSQGALYEGSDGKQAQALVRAVNRAQEPQAPNMISDHDAQALYDAQAFNGALELHNGQTFLDAHTLYEGLDLNEAQALYVRAVHKALANRKQHNSQGPRPALRPRSLQDPGPSKDPGPSRYPQL